MSDTRPNGCALGAVVLAALVASVVLAAWRWVVGVEGRCRA